MNSKDNNQIQSNELGNTEREKTFRTYTSNEIQQLLIDLGRINKPNKIIDLTYENNNLLLPFLDEAQVIQGIDFFQSTILSNDDKNHLINIKSGNPLGENINNKYDLVFCISPLGVRTRINRRPAPLEILLMEKALSILEEKGTLLFMCSSSFLSFGPFTEIRSVIINNYNLKMILTIPPRRGGNVGLDTVLLVITKDHPRNTENVYMPKYENNRLEILESFKNGTGEFYVNKDNIVNRWDRNFHDPKHNKINELLKGKELRRIEELGEVFRGYPYRRNELKPTGKYLILKPRHIRSEQGIQLSEREEYIDELVNERMKRSLIRPGDILINLHGPRGIYIYKETDPPCVAGQMLAIIRANENENEYIKTYLDTSEGQKLFNMQADRKTVGNVMHSLRFSDLRNIKIPIIPIQNLNRLSDRYISLADDKEELENLRRELEVQKAVNESLKLHNEQLMFINNRLEEISKQILMLNKKVDEILNIVKGLQDEISVIKSLRTDEELIISFIEQKIDETVEKLSNNNLNTYIEIAKAWVDPNWLKLDLLSQVFLPNAELLYDSISKMENGDPSPFIIQYCRTLENELLNKIFKPYLRYLKERNITLEDAFSDDLEVNENGRPRNRNKDSYGFAKKLIELEFKDESEWFFELGNMSMILIKLTGRKAGNSPLFNDFKEFLLKYFDESFINRDFYEKIHNEIRLLRNKAAHPNEIDRVEGLKGRELVKGLLKSLLEMYK